MIIQKGNSQIQNQELRSSDEIYDEKGITEEMESENDRVIKEKQSPSAPRKYQNFEEKSEL